MRTDNGAILISRSIYDSDIWHKPSDWLKIWIYILGRVNYGDTNQFKRGSNYFKYEVIALECNTTYKVVVSCIKFLKEGKQVVTHKTTRGNIIEVLNYEKYQDLDNYGKAKVKADSKAKVKADVITIKEERKEKKEIKKEISNIVVATKVASLKDLMIENINKEEFINKGISEDILTREMNKFYNYRIQKNQNGKKEHWQKQKTFDVKRRFITWLGNIKDLSNKKTVGITSL